VSGRLAITALGGGTGLAALLRGLKRESVDLTAVVTVGDDGGSSGRLRRELGVLPPGDIRNCLVALADDESLLGQLFQYRFTEGPLAGHSFGNLFLAALAEVAGGFDRAVEESSHVLRVRGQVLPSTLTEVSLWAERADGRRVKGESAITAGDGPCRRMWLEPMAPPAHPPAVDAIRNADLLILGPGSLFTSVLPHLAVPEIASAVRAARGVRAYICNVMTQAGETDGYSASDHLARVLEAAPDSVDVIVTHSGQLDPDAIAAYARQGQEPVGVDRESLVAQGVRVVEGDLAEKGQVVRHRPDALADLLVALAETAAVAPRAS